MSYFKCYKPHRFGPESMIIVNRANELIEEYEAAGYVLTLRQLYYRFIATDTIPNAWIDKAYNLKNGLPPNTKNTIKNYKRLGAIIVKGREAGLISWTAIEDRSRQVVQYGYQEDPREVLKDIEYGLNFDFWMRQDTYLEVWVEKDALIGVVGKPCSELYVNHMAAKGYLSTSQAWRAGLRFQEARDRGKNCLLLHFGDHDPSGIDMTKDNYKRLAMFVPGSEEFEYDDLDDLEEEEELELGAVKVHRVALNIDQVRQFNPPPNPAKLQDSRYGKYVKKFGNDCWELDALEPSELDRLIREEIEKYIDWDVWKKVEKEQNSKRKELASLYENWPHIVSKQGKACLKKLVMAKKKKDAAAAKKKAAAEKRRKVAAKKRKK